MEGKIKKLTGRGFGFINAEDVEEDLFFHESELEGVDFSELEEGDEVSFEKGEGPKGPNASNVKKL